MLQSIKEFIDKPPLFQKNDAKFWDDPYISQNMLEAHLNPQLEAATRKLDFVQQSVNWITNVLPPNQFKKLIDLGCGAGIYTELFYSKGYQVTGFDLSRNSIQYAKQSAETKQLKIRYLNGDYIQTQIKDNYDLVTMIYCDFGVLSCSERKILLQKIYELLLPNGCFLFDVFTPVKYKDRKEFKIWSYEEKGFWRNEPYLLLHSLYRYDYDNSFLEQYIIAEEDQATCYNIWEHAFLLDELKDDLQNAGFKTLQFYEDVAGSPYKSDSETLCVLAQKE